MASPTRFTAWLTDVRFTDADSTGSDLLDALLHRNVEPQAATTLFQRMSSHKLGLQNIEIPRLADSTTTTQSLSKHPKSSAKDTRAAFDTAVSKATTSKHQAVERLYKITQADRAKAGRV